MTQSATRRQVEIDATLNDFAIRAFRDVADQDYIAARMSFRANLWPQFLWSALQAIEKYLKGILLFNRIPARNIGHDLAAALTRAEQLPFRMEISSKSREVIEHLDRYGRFRYPETGYWVEGWHLPMLDLAVWEIRRYCQPMNIEVTLGSGEVKNLLEAKLSAVEDVDPKERVKLRITGGILEKLIDGPKSQARASLIWQNPCFAARTRSTVKVQGLLHSTYSPLAIRPQYLDEIARLVFIPKDVQEAYAKEAQRRSRAGGRARNPP